MKFSNLVNMSLLIPVCILCLFGLTTLFSINIGYFRSQLLFFVISIFVYFFFARINIQFLRKYSLIIYLISLFLLLIVLALGIESRGAVRWLDFFGLRAQFSEILKPFLGLSLANYLASQKDRSVVSFIMVLLFIAPIAILIILQPDLGSALIYVGVTVFLLLVFGYPMWWFVSGVAFLVILMPIIWHFLHRYQQERILTFIHPTNDPLGTSYNAIQSVIAVGSGKFLGQGLGQGTQSTLRFLPERHTDFIFATLAEGLGFLGTILVITLFMFLLYRIYKLFLTEEDTFAKNFTIIVFAVLLIQFFINSGMNIGIVPVVGVPLPFVSYGGSSLLSNFILLGLLTAATNTKKIHKTLEIR